MNQPDSYSFDGLDRTHVSRQGSMDSLAASEFPERKSDLRLRGRIDAIWATGLVSEPGKREQGTEELLRPCAVGRFEILRAKWII